MSSKDAYFLLDSPENLSPALTSAWLSEEILGAVPVKESPQTMKKNEAVPYGSNVISLSPVQLRRHSLEKLSELAQQRLFGN